MDTPGNNLSYLRTIIIGIVILVVVAGLLMLAPSYSPRGKDSQTSSPAQVTVRAVTKDTPMTSTTIPKTGTKTPVRGTARKDTPKRLQKTSGTSPAPEDLQVPEGMASRVILSVTPVPPRPEVPEDFAITVSPESARAPAGGRVVYTAHIEPEGGFSGSITLKIRVMAPFYDTTYDLGILTPPYPKTIEYPFDVPGYVPGGIQITGVIQAEGGGKKHEKTVYLAVA